MIARKDALAASSIPMLHWGKVQIAKQQTQAIPCKAGVMSGVVYANGDVALCEQHPPIGNLRQNTFPEIWNGEAARALRQSIARKECFCTNEVFLWPSIVFQPTHLAKAFLGSKGLEDQAPTDQRRAHGPLGRPQRRPRNPRKRYGTRFAAAHPPVEARLLPKSYWGCAAANLVPYRFLRRSLDPGGARGHGPR